MSLGFQGDYALDGLHTEPVGSALISRSKLFDHRSLRKGHIVLVGREDLSRMHFRGFLDHLEEARLTLLAIDNKHATKNLMAAMFRIDLGKTEDFRVGERAPVLLFNLVEIIYFLRT